MKKPMKLMIIFLVVLFGGIVGWNVLRSFFINKFFSTFQPPPATISAHPAKEETWHPFLTAIGTFTAQNGVDINSEAAGIVYKIFFDSGQQVAAGDQLLQLDDSVDQATLQDNEAQLSFMEVSFKRQQELIKTNSTAISKVDETRAQLKQAQANVAKTKALIAQKLIKAPFAGRLGIRKVNLGEYITAGTTKIVTLQSLDPLYLEFNLPEQNFPRLSVGQIVKLKSDAFPKHDFIGKITAINSKVDPQTHNILAQAEIPNPKFELLPGMFATVQIELPAQDKVITVPYTAIDYTLYGDSVYVVQPNQTVQRTFVVVGDKQNNRVVIQSGLKAGEIVVDTGQLKLNNGAKVIVNNKVDIGS